MTPRLLSALAISCILAIGFSGGKAAQDAAAVGDDPLSQKLKAIQGKGAGLYNSGDVKGCIKYFVAELGRVVGEFADFPEFQKQITAGIKSAAKNKKSDDEAFALLDVIVQLRKSLQGLDADTLIRMADSHWEKGGTDAAWRLYVRALNTEDAKKLLSAEALAMHRSVLSSIGEGVETVRKTALASAKVHADPSSNGWEVLVSFKNNPQTFARAAQAWTLDHAKELAERVQKADAGGKEDLSVAEIQIKGQDGNGEVKPSQSLRLPDWPLVEQRFRARTRAKAQDFEPQLRELKTVYQKAAVLAEEVLQSNAPAPPDKQKALTVLAKQYNDKLGELEKALGEPQPLPQLTFSPATKWEDHRPGWAETKRIQYDFEKEGQKARAKQAELQAEQERLRTEWKKALSERLTGKQSGPLAQWEQEVKEAAGQFGQQVKSLGKDKQLLKSMNDSIANQLANQERQLVDSGRIAPSGDLFAVKPGGAVLKSVPQVKVLKTDAQGRPLADDKQPPGYPKTLQEAAALAKDEKAFVDPSLEVELLPEQPEDLKAGVYGKVSEVDPTAGTVTVDVGNKGAKLIYEWIQPEGIKVGDAVTPTGTLGKWKPYANQSNVRRVRIVAVNYQGQPIAPGPVLESAATPSPEPGKADKDGADGDNKNLVLTPGKYVKDKWLDYDDSMPKNLADSSKREGLSLREAVAKRALDRLKEAEDDKISEAVLLKAKLRQVEQELQAAKDKLKASEKKGDKLLGEAKEIQRRADLLKSEFEKLKASKQELDNLAVKAKNSKKNDDIKAFNAKAKDHNAKFKKYEAEVDDFENDKQSLADRIGEAGREQLRDEKKSKDLAFEKGQLESKQKSAETALKQARTQREAKEAEVRQLQAELAKLEAALEKAQKNKKSGSEP